jgi:hypothetical protein
MFRVEVDSAPLPEGDPAAAEPLISGPAHPPMNRPNTAMTPNEFNDRSDMLVPILGLRKVSLGSQSYS